MVKQQDFDMLRTQVDKMSVQVEDIHNLLKGKDGTNGMFSEWQQVKGSVKMLGWILGLVGVSGFIAFIKLLTMIK